MGQSSPVYETDFENMNTYTTPTNWTNMGGIIQVLSNNAINGSKSARFGGNTNTSIVAMPSISNINTLQITFSQKSDTNAGTLEVGYVTSTSDASTFNTIFSYSASDYTTANTATVSLSTASSGAYIAFRHTTATTYKYWYIDDIIVEIASTSCSTPTDILAEATSSTTANVSWTAGSTETAWQLYYSYVGYATPANAAEGDFIPINTTPSYTLTGLIPNTEYFVYVRAKCGEDDYSDWTEAERFTTLNPQSLPVINDFEDGDDDLEDWTMRDANANTGVYDSETYSSSLYCFRFYSPFSGSTQYLITPELNGTTNGVYVQFYRKQPYAGAYIQVGYSTETISTEDFTWSDATPNAAATKYVAYELYCPAGTKFVAIKYTSTTSTSIYIDNISITVPPTANTNGNWNNAATWATGAVPSSSANVVISSNVTIPNGYTATVNNITIDGGSLTIADGAQLICKNAVQATVKKAIAGAGEGAKWYTISSPVDNIEIANVTGLLTNDYDLYRYNEESVMWENYKAHNSGPEADFTNMTNGRGYLYRNAQDVELQFTGSTNAGDVACPLSYTDESGDLSGFHLIGNPYPHSIAKGEGKAIYNAALASGYYSLNVAQDAWLACEDGDEIEAMQGVLVQTTEALADFTIQDIIYTGGAKANHDNIMFTVGNSDYSDVTYAMFDKGHGLNKISHRNANVPMLYIPQNGENFAIAMMDDNTKAFDLNFKAMTTGKYTLSCKTKGNYSYLHVIDRLTGEDLDMLLEDEYSFIGSKNDNANRFIVRLEYSENPAGLENPSFAWQNGSDIIIEGEGELQIFDVMGRRVSTMRVSGETTITAPSMQGVYIFKLNEKSQKIVVK